MARAPGGRGQADGCFLVAPIADTHPQRETAAGEDVDRRRGFGHPEWVVLGRSRTKVPIRSCSVRIATAAAMVKGEVTTRRR